MKDQNVETTQPELPQRSRRRSNTPPCSAKAKAEAVLKIWAERSTPSQLCRELGVTWNILNQWQQRAMEGMLQALEPRVVLDKGPALSPRLQALLTRKLNNFSQKKLARQLQRLEQREPTGA